MPEKTQGSESGGRGAVPPSSGQGGTRFSCVWDPFLCVSEGKNFVLEDEDPNWAFPVPLANPVASDCEARSDDVES